MASGADRRRLVAVPPAGSLANALRAGSIVVTLSAETATGSRRLPGGSAPQRPRPKHDCANLANGSRTAGSLAVPVRGATARHPQAASGSFDDGRIAEISSSTTRRSHGCLEECRRRGKVASSGILHWSPDGDHPPHALTRPGVSNCSGRLLCSMRSRAEQAGVGTRRGTQQSLSNHDGCEAVWQITV